MESRQLIQGDFYQMNYTLLHEPPDIYLDDHIMDIKFSPVGNVLAVAQVTGEVRLYQYREDESQEMLTLKYHEDSCRRVEFSEDGNILYTASADGSIGVVSNGILEGRLTASHPCPINSILHIDQGCIIATGDDDGMIKIWDLRQATSGKKSACQIKFKEHDGTISDLAINDDKTMLLSAGGDGCLGVFDLRKSELYALSDNFEEDLTAVVICKYGKKVAASSSEGIINLFSWDWFGDCNDRIIGHPNSIDTMIKFDEDTLITGSEDGLLRAVSVLPNKILAILGDPTDQDDDPFHIQRVTISHDRNLLASCSLDDIVKIIDISHLHQRVKEVFDDEQYEAEVQAEPKNQKKSKKNKKNNQESGNNEEMKNENEESKGSAKDSWESESDDSDDSDDSDMSVEENKKKQTKNKQLNPKTNNVQRSKKMIEQEKRKQFFSDL